MSDENKTKINPNVNDDLNLDFDIILDKNDEPNKPKEEATTSSKSNTDINSDLNFDINPSSLVKEEVKITTNTDTITQEIAPIQEVQEPPQTPQEEVIIPEMAIPVVEIPVIEIPEEVVEKTIAPEITTEQPTTESTNEIPQTWDSSYTPDLNSINETIQQLQDAKNEWKQTITSSELNEIPVIQTLDANIIQQEKEQEKTNEVPSWSINLDDILPVPEIQPQAPIQNIPQVQFPQEIQRPNNPYDMAPQQTIQTGITEHKKHLFIIIWIVAVCLIAWFFILKTMYPIQFGASDWWPAVDTGTTAQIVDMPPQDNTIPPTDIMFTWDATGTENTWIINELTWNILDISWNIEDHNITTWQWDPFQVLDNIQTQEEIKKQATIDSLKEFATKWQYYLDLWKQKWIKDMLKYWVYLTGKANIFVNQIENWEILDISSLDSNLAQFSVYLQKLQDLENASNTPIQGQTGIQEQNTWTQDPATWSNARIQ